MMAAHEDKNVMLTLVCPRCALLMDPFSDNSMSHSPHTVACSGPGSREF